MHAARRGSPRQRFALLLMPVATVAVHQLRYLLAYGSHAGRALADQGDYYVESLTPVLGVLVAIVALGWQLARARRSFLIGPLWGSPAVAVDVEDVEFGSEGSDSPSHALAPAGFEGGRVAEVGAAVEAVPVPVQPGGTSWRKPRRAAMNISGRPIRPAISAIVFRGGEHGADLRHGRSSRSLQPAVRPGWALVSDTALVVDPVTRQCIAHAFRDAELLADAIASRAWTASNDLAWIHFRTVCWLSFSAAATSGTVLNSSLA